MLIHSIPPYGYIEHPYANTWFYPKVDKGKYVLVMKKAWRRIVWDWVLRFVWDQFQCFAAITETPHHIYIVNYPALSRSDPSSQAFEQTNGTAGLLARSLPAPPSHESVRRLHSDDKTETAVLWNLQQRDCPGFSPDSLLSDVKISIHGTVPSQNYNFYFISQNKPPHFSEAGGNALW